MITLKIMRTGYDKRHGCTLRKIPKGGTPDFKWQGWLKDFGGGLKCYFSISGFFWVGKFWQVFPQVAWFKKGFFWVFKTTVSVFRVISFNAIWKSLRLGKSAWDFLGFQVLPPFDHPCHLKSGVPPPASYPRGKLKGAQCSEPVKS